MLAPLVGPSDAANFDVDDFDEVGAPEQYARRGSVTMGKAWQQRASAWRLHIIVKEHIVTTRWHGNSMAMSWHWLPQRMATTTTRC